MKHKKTRAAEARGLKEFSADTEKRIKVSIKTVPANIPENNKEFCRRIF